MASQTDAGRVRVALIDDDSGLLAVLEPRFAALGWESHRLAYPATAPELAALRLSALLVNPALTGLDYVERLPLTLPGLPVLVCSDPAPLAERIRGLRAGADDWITKPCHPEEMVARIEAVLRRGRIAVQDDAISSGELTIRPDRFDAFVGTKRACLSRKEYELVYELASAGRVLQREEIYQRVWGYAMAHGDRSVDVFVRKLRQKLERISPGWRYVHTHFGVGYRFAAEPQSPGIEDTPPTPVTEAEPVTRAKPDLVKLP